MVFDVYVNVVAVIVHAVVVVVCPQLYSHSTLDKGENAAFRAERLNHATDIQTVAFIQHHLLL